MKLWYHVIAAVVGFVLAALVVYLVFGNASQQAATQDGSAPGSLGSSGLICGTITPGEASSPDTLKLARANQPALFTGNAPVEIRADHPEQRTWVARVMAASGLCIDEIRLDTATISIAFSAPEKLTTQQAETLVAGALTQAFTAPFAPPRSNVAIKLSASIGTSERTAVISVRAWGAYQASRRQLGVPFSMKRLAAFQRSHTFGAGDLRLVGWS